MASLQKAQYNQLQNHYWRIANKRLILPVILFALLAAPSTREITVAVLSDAFWQVAAYVAATLTIYHIIANKMSQKSRLKTLLNSNSRYQVIFAALMGALPGCGGAIVVITQYVRGQLSFGAVVAVLTATMGDAAFLLLATEPSTGLLMMVIGCCVGLISGWIVDATHGCDFMRPELKPKQDTAATQHEKITSPTVLKLQGQFWKWVLAPAIVIAIMGSLQIDIDQTFKLSAGTIDIIGTIAVIMALLLWATSRDITDYESAVSEDPKLASSHMYQRIAQDTNFVTSWVIGAFLIFELTIFWTGVDLQGLFSHWALLIPLMGVMIGLLPGCGPQIIVTSLYLSGAIPMSAQIGNAISNDGDALFPAIALAPKAALIATLYSTLPAIIAAYGYFFFFE
ncbi:putative manganese transporter [Photobacterium sanguinicancri]|uniref:putative manganese transporter n=1 Tax=Photobacterium sanguinicancri TaxID=875932 RepID=UPI0026E28451|nr:putative manganese transporter [Photobacterium sanguinicancri]MDO6498361.1 putative manganese transporter [Photobacterium sanguinicancri]